MLNPDGRLWTVPVEGGLPRVFGEVPESYRAIFPVWLANDKIAVTRENEIWTATVDNPVFQVLARLDSTLRFDHIGMPQRLPDPDKMLVSLTEASLLSGSAEWSAAWVNLRDGSFHMIREGAGMPIYANSGHLIYNEGSNNAIVVQPFDVTTLRLYGQKQTLGLGFLWTNFDFSESGVFTTFHGQSEYWISSSTIIWDDEMKATMATSDEQVTFIQFSDDGQYVGVWKRDSASLRDKLVVLRRDGSPIDEITGTNPPADARIADNGIAYIRLRNPVNNRYVILRQSLGSTRAADTLTTIERSSTHLDTSKDGSNVLLRKEDGQVIVRDIETSEDRPVPSNPPGGNYSPNDSFISWVEGTGGLRRLFASRIDGEQSWILADSIQHYSWQNEKRIVYQVQFKDPIELRELTLSTADGLAPESERILGTYDFLSNFDVDPVIGRVLLLLNEQGDAKLDIVVNWFSYLEEVAPTGRN